MGGASEYKTTADRGRLLSVTFQPNTNEQPHSEIIKNQRTMSFQIVGLLLAIGLAVSGDDQVQAELSTRFRDGPKLTQNRLSYDTPTG